MTSLFTYTRIIQYNISGMLNRAKKIPNFILPVKGEIQWGVYFR